MDDVDTGKTASDEAKDHQKAQRPMMTVTTSLPQGVVLNNHLGHDGKPSAAANMGPGGPIEIRGSQDVDKEFWDAWKANNQSLIDNGIVSAVPKAEQIENEADARGENLGRESSRNPEQDLDEAGKAEDA